MFVPWLRNADSARLDRAVVAETTAIPPRDGDNSPNLVNRRICISVLHTLPDFLHVPAISLHSSLHASRRRSCGNPSV